MTPDQSSDRIASVQTKLERAKRHYAELTSEVQRYLATQPYAIASRLDPVSARRVYYIDSVQPTPLAISAILGDTIHNLRSALDHLAYQLVWIGTGSPPSNHVYFPIADDKGRYPSQRDKQIKGARPEAVSAIDQLAPYRGGNDVLWRIHKLNNVDKHRVLITAGSAFQSVDIGGIMRREMQAAHDSIPEFAGMVLPQIALFLKPADRLFPLKAGSELFIDAPNAVEDRSMQFQFELAFGEADVVSGEPIIETVEPMVTAVEQVIAAFMPMLR
ncbi:MAG TPA: hypothetical protein VIV60_14470 [Polyangiaceae bacterium]